MPYVFWYLIEDYLFHSLLHPFYVLVKEPVKFSPGQVKLFVFMLLAKIRILVNGNYLLLRSHLWFFPALFITNIGYSIYRLYDRRSLEVCKYLNYSPAVVVLLLWVWMFTKIQRIAILHAFGIIPFGIDIVFYLLPFFIVLDSVYKNRVAMCRIHLLVYIIIIIISINLISYFEPLKTHVPLIKRIDLAVLSVPNTMIGFIAMCTLSAGIMMLFLKLGRVKFFIYLGTYSLPIFVLHHVVAARVNIVLSHLMKLFNFNDTLVFLIYLLSIILSIFIPIIISKGLMKILPVFRYIGMVA